MSDQHTPGDWLIRHVNPKAPEIVYIQTGEGYLGGRSVAVLYPSEHSEADALLIASAPALLATLKLVRKLWAKDDSCIEIDAIDAAIAKAEGK